MTQVRLPDGSQRELERGRQRRRPRRADRPGPREGGGGRRGERPGRRPLARRCRTAPPCAAHQEGSRGARGAAPLGRAPDGRRDPAPVPARRADDRAGGRGRLLLRHPHARGKLTPDDFPRIEEEMARIAGEAAPFERCEVTDPEKDEVFARYRAIDGGHNKFKLELVGDIRARGEELSFYRHGDFVDLCRGPHVPNTGWLKNVKLTSVAGSYWRADASREQLVRVYGTAFFDKQELEGAPAPARGGAQARSPRARRAARPVLASTRRRPASRSSTRRARCCSRRSPTTCAACCAGAATRR